MAAAAKHERDRRHNPELNGIMNTQLARLLTGTRRVQVSPERRRSVPGFT